MGAGLPKIVPILSLLSRKLLTVILALGRVSFVLGRIKTKLGLMLLPRKAYFLPGMGVLPLKDQDADSRPYLVWRIYIFLLNFIAHAYSTRKL